MIFGAHGDLTKRLLMPALYNLTSEHLLDDGFRIIGVDRVGSSDDDWRKELSATMQEFTKDKTAEFYVETIDEGVWGWVTQRLSYVEADFTKNEDIDRLDHFLGKETVQNIMALRFANGIFEPLWKRDHISHVEITAAETIGVEGRGAFYEPTGALRDMVPNHLFQILAMIAMEPPNSFDAEDVRTEKAKLAEAVRPVAEGDVVRGQYTAGTVQGQTSADYRHEPNVAPDSSTETYVALRLMIDNWRWAGVPFYLRTGKRMTSRRTECVVHFRQAPYAMFRDTPVDKLAKNTLILGIQPVEGLALTVSAKHPGPTMTLAPVDLAFKYSDVFKQEPNVGYETLIYDCLIGDNTLFQRADNIEAGWAAVDPALKNPPAVEMYAAGSPGPAGADALLAKDGNRWHSLDEGVGSDT